ncbi:MAG: methyltransferase, partial [Rhizobiaceae bacterium]
MATSITTDYFLDSAIAVQQMKGAGHRSGLDAIMLAATPPQDLQGQVADLGAGAGVVGLAAAHRCRHSRVDLFEINPQLTELSNQSLQLEQNRHLAGRVTGYCADITQSGEPLASSGGQPGSYAAILCNPPYNDNSHQASPDD